MTHNPTKPPTTRTMPTVNGQPTTPGCYISGHWGQYAVDRLADLCDLFSPYRLQTDYWVRTVAELRDAEDWDTLAELDDYMTERLNGATRGGHWYWQDGELFLHDGYFCSDCGEPSDLPQCDVCADTEREELIRMAWDAAADRLEYLQRDDSYRLDY